MPERFFACLRLLLRRHKIGEATMLEDLVRGPDYLHYKWIRAGLAEARRVAEAQELEALRRIIEANAGLRTR